MTVAQAFRYLQDHSLATPATLVRTLTELIEQKHVTVNQDTQTLTPTKLGEAIIGKYDEIQMQVVYSPVVR